ncbi:MAG: DUF1801 domain-containing protein [Candidatus Dojkabacteria bacterium]
MTPEEEFKNRVAELTDWRGPVFAKLKIIIESADPELELMWKWGTAVWDKKGLVCAIGAFNKGIKINFFKGASLSDLDKLFNAGLEAKKTRAIDIFEGDKINEKALVNLVKEAINFNK